MDTPCIKGSYVERMNDAIVWSESSRVQANLRGKEIGDEARQELITRYRLKRVAPPSKPMLDTVANKAIEKDERWGVLVGQEQWACRLADMYALAEVALSQRETVQVLKAQYEQQAALLREQRATNELLRSLLRALAPTDRVQAPAPAQREGD